MIKNLKFIYILAAVAAMLSGCSAFKTVNPPDTVQGIPVEHEQITPEQAENIAVPTAAPVKEPFRVDTYDISIEIDPELRTIKDGFEKLVYQNKSDEPMEIIYFNIYLNAFNRFASAKPYFPVFQDKIFKNGSDYGSMNIKNVSVNNRASTFSVSGTVLSVTLPEPLPAGEVAEISLIFEAYVPKISHRTGANDYAMWFGNFFPIVAVYDNDGWHTEPYYPAGDPFYSSMSNFNVKITAPKDYVVVGTGEETATETGDKKTTLITAKMDRDFAFAISRDYKVETIKTLGGVYINFYHYSEFRNTPAILNAASRSLDYYSSVIGKYPYLSFDIVETELFAEMGMEYPELTFVDSEYLQKSAAIQSIAHEIAHQYFYNVIGNNQINEAWLDEGLASFFQFAVFMDEDEMKLKMETDYESLKNRIEGYEFRTLTDDISVYKSWNNYYNIQYVRARLMIYSLRNKMGVDKFGEFIKAYYENNSFRKSNRERFVQAAEEAFGDSLAKFFGEWLDSRDLPALDV